MSKRFALELRNDKSRDRANGIFARLGNVLVRRSLISVVILLWAGPVLAQANLLPTVQRFRAQYPPTMSEPQKAELLNRVAWEHRAEGWGLLKKTGGSRCPAPQGVDVACDILVYAPTAWHFDVLISGQIPQWLDDGPCISPPSGCDMARFLAPVRPAQVHVTLGDADGDAKAEVALFRPESGYWFVGLSSTNYTDTVSVQWGLPTDIPLLSDFDGDGRTDLTVYRPSTGEWFIRFSAQNYETGSTFTWGLAGDVPVPGDYDGDGRTDFAVFRPATGSWHIIPSSTGVPVSPPIWGGGGDIPVQADYDGDGKTDIAVFRPATGAWYIINSSTISGRTVIWGGGGDIPVAADYDGDGKTDIAVFRPANGAWYIIKSSTMAGTAVVWGGGGDVPVPADYDGDGLTDIGVFRPSTGTWYIVQSSLGTGVAHVFGGAFDQPIMRRP